MISKKAQAQVIVTVLIILLVLAVIGVVATMVTRTVGKSAAAAENQTENVIDTLAQDSCYVDSDCSDDGTLNCSVNYLCVDGPGRPDQE